MEKETLSRDFLDTKQLAMLKAKALRLGIWYKALQRIDRVLIDLTIKVANMIRNAKLVKSLLTVTNKLEIAMAPKMLKTFEEIGVPLAQRFSTLALKLGNVLARSWATDFRFARFLAIMRINDPRKVGL